MKETSESGNKENNLDIRIMANSLHDLLCILFRMEEGIIPRTEEMKKAIQNYIKEFCMAILENL